MNRKQRDKNRANAKMVSDNAIICPECGERGPHWVGFPYTLQNLLDEREPAGFWICAKFYGPDGRRLEP